ncbi:MAG TPA: RNA polymerase sigma factor WhiG [Acidimicrobiales bacterium]|nr:RNA polymerase sigma factor WhiG [Acidimicrobiales bacterium]
MEPQPSAITELWDEFKASGSMDARNRLVLHYSPLVKYVAGRLSAGLPNSIEQADLVSYGMFGLIDAINKFEPARGFKFETYAMSRIRGSIIDELRSIDWVPRSLRAKARAVEKVYTKLEHELLRTPTDVEVADELGSTEEELQNVFTQISFFGLVALEETVSVGADRSESVTLGDTIPDTGIGPVGAFEVEETKQILAKALNRLPEREKIVLTLYYYEGLTLGEIGGILGITESRVCQIHTKAVIQLRSKLAEPQREPA